MNKLSINKPFPADLSSLSVFPPYDRSVPRANVPRYNSQNRCKPPEPNRQPQPLQSLFYSSSQSQQSLSQGVTLSQNTQQFSQISQDDPFVAFEEWKCNREVGKRKPSPCIPPQSSRCYRDTGSKLALSSSSNLLQRMNTCSLPEMNGQSSEELEKRLDSLGEDVRKVITVLDSVRSDLQKLPKAVEAASLEAEGIKQQMMLQENSLQSLIKEETNFKTTISSNLRRFSERADDTVAQEKLESLSRQLEILPSTLARHISTIKTELCSFVRGELQTVRDSMRFKEEDWSTAEKAFHHTADLAQSRHIAMEQEEGSQKSRLDTKKKNLLLKNACGDEKQGKRPTALNRKGRPLSSVTKKKKGKAATTKKGASVPVSEHHLTRYGTKQLKSDDEGWIEKRNFQRQPRSGRRAMWLQHSTKSTADWNAGSEGKHANNNDEVPSTDLEQKYDSFLFALSEVPGRKTKSQERRTENIFDEPLPEEEAREIREKMMKARKKRYRFS